MKAILLPGHAEACATVFLGYGRTRAGHSGSGAGFDAYKLRTSDAPDLLTGVSIKDTGMRFLFSVTQ